MFNKDKSKQDSQEDIIDPEVAKIMGPPPEEALPRLSADMENVVSDEQQKINQILGPPELAGDPSDKEASIQSTGVANTEVPKISPAAKDNNEQSTEDIVSDPKTDQVVKDIIASEGDDLLSAEDEAHNYKIVPKRPKGLRGFIHTCWHNKKIRNILFIVIFGTIFAAILLPTTRYAILNSIGVRASTNLRVIDSKSGRPVKNVEVTIANVTLNTDNKGEATIKGLKLGKTELVLKKRSFATVKQSIIVGWGSNPYVDPFQLDPVGSQYKFEIIDWLSKKPIPKAEVTDGDSIAIAGNDGKAILTIEPKEDDLKIKIKADGYREETVVSESTDKTDKIIKLVPYMPDVFVSRRSGKYDLYKKDADGKNETILLMGTGNEQEDISILVHPKNDVAAFVSSREGKRNKQGFLLSNLYIVDIKTKIVSKVEDTEAEKIQLLDWIGDKLIFVKIVAGPSANVTGRQRAISYDYKQEKQTELASANYFNDIEVINQKIYYAPSSGGLVSANSQLFKINPDNSLKTNLIDKETWVLYRSSYDKIQISAVNNSWYEVGTNDSKVTRLAGAPASPNHKIYIDSPNEDYSLWVDTRDGKGVLVLQNLKTNAEKVLFSKGGLGYPIRWLNAKNVLFRITNSQETADYVLNIDGGEVIKVSDVTSTSNTNRWYYYR